MTPSNPPIAARKPYVNEAHGVQWTDDWHWLRDPNYPNVQDPEVLDYLKAENAYFKAAMKPHEALVEQLFQEMKGRIKEDDSSVPIKDGDWFYRSAFKEGPNIATGTGGPWPAATNADLARMRKPRQEYYRRRFAVTRRQAAGDAGRR
jgi:protease II